MLRIIEILRKSSLACYPENKNCYEIIAPDILFDDAYNPWLLEVNSKPGFKSAHKPSKFLSTDVFFRKFLTWEFNAGIEPIFNPFILTRLSEATGDQIQQLLKLVSDPAIMKYVGQNGKPWTRPYVLELISYDKQDGDSATRQQFIAVQAGKVVGYIAFRPMYKSHPEVLDDDVQLRIVADPGHGYGHKMMEHFKLKRIWALVYKSNDASNKFFASLGWASYGTWKNENIYRSY